MIKKKNFNKAKIYMITSKDGGLPYIGSTALPLKVRLSIHYSRGHLYSVKNHIDKPDFVMQVLENYPCENEVELKKRERYWTEQINCCNKRRPYRSLEERNEYMKEYYKGYSDKWKQYHKDRYKTRLLRQLPFFNQDILF